jgi:hypothetical protein
LFEGYTVSGDNRFVESQSGFRTVPFDEFTNGVIIGTLGAH